MKRVASAGLVVVLLVAFVACEGGAVSDDDAKGAFVYSFGAVFMSSFALAFGEEVEGVSIEEETQDLILDGFDFASFGQNADEQAAAEIPYTAVSGRVTQENEMMVADLTLEGGPVDTLAFELGGEIFQAAGAITLTVTANGTEMELTLDPEDLQ